MDPKEITGLMEAYSEVYAPQQELTEEQIWEEVENWVNSLVEEGYDLSEYSWEDMYEAYLSEMGQARTTGQNSSVLRTTPGAGSASGQGGRRGSGSSPGGVRPSFQSSGGYGKYAPPSSQVKTPAPAKPTPGAGASPVKPAGGTVLAKKGGVEGKLDKSTGKFTSGTFSSAEKSRYGAAASKSPTSAAAPKVTPTAAAKPATPAKPAGPATGTLGKTSFERRTPTSAELKGAQAARASGASPEKALQAAKSAGGALSQATAAASKPPAFSPSSSSSSSSPAPTAAPKPNLQKSIRANRLNMSFDLFDVVMGHLLDEGYADTQEAALAIMANMSEEWRQSIVEQSNTLVTPDQRRADELKYGMKRTTPVPSKSAKSGPKMPL